MYYFCTYFDQNYFSRGMALYQSMLRHIDRFTLFVLCLDRSTYETISSSGFRSLIPISLEELEKNDSELLAAKSNRNRVEYYFTCTPCFPLYILRGNPSVDILTYVDADLYFYSSPAPVYSELGDRSILIVEHRFPEHLRHLERYGIYNVGWLSFRNDPAGLECLAWWRQRCLGWCYDRLEDDRFADQKYLDDWTQRFRGVHVLQNKGAGLAPWNWMQYHINYSGDSCYIDDEPLIFYHFQGLRLIGKWLYEPGFVRYGPMPRQLRKWFYGTYMKELQEIERAVPLRSARILSDSVSHRVSPYGFKALLLKIIQGEIMLRPV
ncbi:MAG TPA: glycosyl transferase [bacterium]|nr:glycosyl transferase [bacterium]